MEKIDSRLAATYMQTTLQNPAEHDLFISILSDCDIPISYLILYSKITDQDIIYSPDLYDPESVELYYAFVAPSAGTHVFQFEINLRKLVRSEMSVEYALKDALDKIRGAINALPTKPLCGVFLQFMVNESKVLTAEYILSYDVKGDLK